MLKKVIFVGMLFCVSVLIGCGESRERHIYLCYDPVQYACSNQGDDMKLCILTEVADGEDSQRTRPMCLRSRNSS